MSPADDRKLIKVVECHHVLWDNRMKEFRDKMLTQHGWKSVAELLDREEEDVMCRWANLRKQYSRRITRLRQRTGNESPEKPWQLMPLMAFLRPCITPRKRIHSRTHTNGFSSTEEISSSHSDDSRELSPLVVRINPVEPPRNSLFSCIPEKNTAPQSSCVQRKPFRKFTTKVKTALVSNIPSEKKISSSPTKEEHSDHPSPSSSPEAQEPSVHKLSPTSQCDGPKPPQTAIRSLPPKAKKLKTTSESNLPSNATSESERKPKPLAGKTMSSVTKGTKVSSETQKKSKVSTGKTVSSVIKSTNGSLEMEKKVEIFSETSLPVAKSTYVLLEPEKRLKTFAETSLPVAKSTNVSSEVLVHRGYDSDEHFLLSLADDFRKMDPRQKFECKIKMIGMVCEQYIKNEF